MRRALAALAALAMVIAAVGIRGLLDDDAGGAEGDVGPRVVVCDQDFEAACAALGGGVEVRVEDSATTSAAIVAGERRDVDAWVTTDAWWEITADRAQSAGLGEAEALASSPVLAAVVPGRTAAVDALCQGRTTWRCLGENAGRPWADLGGEAGWGPLATGMPDADTATGLSVLASAAVGFFDSSAFASNEFTDDFTLWLRRLTDASGAGDPDPALSMVTQLGRYTAAGTPSARADAIRATRPLDELDAMPVVAATAVLVDLSGGGAGDPAALRSSLVDAGWTAADGSPPSLLRSGVMGALHNAWKDVVS